MPIPETATTIPDSPYQVSPANVAAATAGRDMLQAASTPMFHLVHHASNWEVGTVDGEAVWLPELVEVAIQPGVNQCRTLRQGEDPDQAWAGQLVWFAKRGQIAIPMTARVGDTGCYIASTPCQNPRNKKIGTRHFDVWSSPKPSRPGRAVKYWRDENAYNRWRLELVEHGWVMPDGVTGRIPDADPDVIAEHLDRAEYHLHRKEAETGLPDRAYREEVAKREEIVERLSGARIPHYLGAKSVPVAAAHTALVALLSRRVEAGEPADVVLAEFPDLDDAICAAVRAAVPAEPLRSAPAKGKGK